MASKTSLIPEQISATIELLRKESLEKASQGQKAIDDGNALIKESQAKRRLADELTSLYSFHAAPVPAAESGVLTLEALTAYLVAGNGGRINHIAAHFGVTEQVVSRAMQQSGGSIFVGARGWIKLNPLA